jgi:hypothetical protein
MADDALRPCRRVVFATTCDYGRTTEVKDTVALRHLSSTDPSPDFGTHHGP